MRVIEPRNFISRFILNQNRGCEQPIGLEFMWEGTSCLPTTHHPHVYTPRYLHRRSNAWQKLLALHPHLKARLVSFGNGSCGSTSWMSCFLPSAYRAHAADVKLLLRFLLLADSHPDSACFCSETNQRDGLFLEHVLTCSHLRGFTRTHRHNLVLVALDHNIRRFGLLTSLEPTFYAYPDGSAKRPDLTVFTSPPIATDLCITTDPAAALAAKSEKHSAAVFAQGHAFIPIALSVFGELHQSVDEFLRHVFQELPPSTKRLAILETKRALSESWATATASMLRADASSSSATMYIQDFFGGLS